MMQKIVSACDVLVCFSGERISKTRMSSFVHPYKIFVWEHKVVTKDRSITSHVLIVLCKPILAILLQRKHQTIINASRVNENIKCVGFPGML